MKRLVVILSLVVGFTIILSGCSSNKNKYSKSEESIINFANNEINKLYDVKINKDDLEYKVYVKIRRNKKYNIEITLKMYCV